MKCFRCSDGGVGGGGQEAELGGVTPLYKCYWDLNSTKARQIQPFCILLALTTVVHLFCLKIKRV